MSKKRKEEAKTKFEEPCWVCGIPAPVERHHIVPQALGIKPDPSLLDTMGGLAACTLPLCRACHSFVTFGLGSGVVHPFLWILSEMSKEPGPRWARIMLLKFAEYLAMLEIAAKNGFKPWEYAKEVEEAVKNLGAVTPAKVSEQLAV